MSWEEALAKFVEILKATEFIAAIVGAVVGGLIAYLVQVKALNEARAQREEDRKETAKAVSYSLLVKVLQIHAKVHATKKYMERAFGRAEEERFEGRPWQIVKPIANPPQHIRINNDELALLFSLDNFAEFNRVLKLDSLYSDMVEVISTFNGRKIALTDAIPGSMAGDAASFTLSKEQILAFGPSEVARFV